MNGDGAQRKGKILRLARRLAPRAATTSSLQQRSSSAITCEPRQSVSARSTKARKEPASVRWLAILAFAFPWCPKSPDACERLAARLMPNPDTTFINRCRADSAMDSSYARMVDCLLAIDGGLNDKQINTCAGSDRLPPFFQF